MMGPLAMQAKSIRTERGTRARGAHMGFQVLVKTRGDPMRS